MIINPTYISAEVVYVFLTMSEIDNELKTIFPDNKAGDSILDYRMCSNVYNKISANIINNNQLFNISSRIFRIDWLKSVVYENI
jgi:hypothetical protein